MFKYTWKDKDHAGLMLDKKILELQVDHPGEYDAECIFKMIAHFYFKQGREKELQDMIEAAKGISNPFKNTVKLEGFTRVN